MGESRRLEPPFEDIDRAEIRAMMIPIAKDVQGAGFTDGLGMLMKQAVIARVLLPMMLMKQAMIARVLLSMMLMKQAVIARVLWPMMLMKQSVNARVLLPMMPTLL